MRKVGYNIISDTQDLVYRINKIKKVAEKRERQNLADKLKDAGAGGAGVDRIGDLDSGADGQPPGLSPIPRHASNISINLWTWIQSKLF